MSVYSIFEDSEEAIRKYLSSMLDDSRSFSKLYLLSFEGSAVPFAIWISSKRETNEETSVPELISRRGKLPRAPSVQPYPEATGTLAIMAVIEHSTWAFHMLLYLPISR
ncbi:hypothetical protein KM043_002673 [Ampulex compressa]|nr:hypothetical protein KM043_002673 [Ampulex compressa]